MPPPTDAVAPSHVRVERREHVALVTINRPKVLNALDEVAHAQLAAAWDELAVDETVWVVILRGAGESAFCVGGDLRAARARTAAGASPPKRVGGFGGLTERFDYPKPVIAAVHGWCLGGGFELALACDLVVASADARFGLPEPRRGLVPTGGGPHRLARQLPLKQTMRLVLTASIIDAGQAHAMGLVNEVVAPGKHVEAALRLADEVLACAPAAVCALKQQVLSGLDRPLAEAMRVSYPLTERQRASADRKEGLAAFAERRSPHWTGR